jgi:O-antigen/teichoic acid export membrane protein
MTMVRSVSIVLRGMIIAQGIAFLALPVLTRLLPVEAFGQFQVYMSIISVGLVFAALRYELALLRCRTGPELRATFQLCLLINLAVAVVGGAGYALFRVVGWSATVSNWAFGGPLLGLGLLLGGLVQTLSLLSTREEAFRTGANARIAQSGVYAGTGVGLGYAAPSPLGLIWADAAGKAVSAGLLLAWSYREGIARLQGLRARRLLWVACKHRNFALFTVPGSLLGALTIALVPIAIFTRYGAEAAGQFGLAERAILLPVNLVVVALAQVFTAKLARELREGGKAGRSLYRQMVLRCAFIGIVPTLVAFPIISPLVVFVFGGDWALAGELAEILILYNFISFVVGGIQQTLVVSGAQRQQVAWDLMRFLAVVAVWGLVFQLDVGLVKAVAIHYAAQSLCYVAYIVLGDRILARAHPAAAEVYEPVIS